MRKIMVVDDDKDLLLNMKTFLQRQGYDVAVTTSCEEGMNILESFGPDLILLDINVGDEDGRVMCKEIKAQAEYEHIPVILMSADHGALRLYTAHRANGFLNKPFQLTSLGDTLSNHL